MCEVHVRHALTLYPQGDAKVLGLSNRDSALVNISFTVNWALAQDGLTVHHPCHN
jgi:hypothetical protein